MFYHFQIFFEQNAFCQIDYVQFDCIALCKPENTELIAAASSPKWKQEKNRFHFTLLLHDFACQSAVKPA
jgi:hypothetical protein